MHHPFISMTISSLIMLHHKNFNLHQIFNEVLLLLYSKVGNNMTCSYFYTFTGTRTQKTVILRITYDLAIKIFSIDQKIFNSEFAAIKLKLRLLE